MIKFIKVSWSNDLEECPKTFSSAEILLSPAEIACEPNDGHLEIFKKVIKFSRSTNIKECFEYNSGVLRHFWAYWDLFEPNDRHLGISK